MYKDQYYNDLRTFLKTIIDSYNNKSGLNAVIFPLTTNPKAFSKDFLDCLTFCDITYFIFDVDVLAKNNISLASLSQSINGSALYSLPINENITLYNYYNKNLSSLVLCFSFSPTTYSKLYELYTSVSNIATL